MSWTSPSTLLVDAASEVVERRIDRRGLLTRMSLVGAAVATSGLDFVLRPGTAYSSVCGPGSSCNSGWAAMCCTLNDGVNQCPPGTFAGGWWKATGARLCGGKSRYYVDCHATCTKCGCKGGRQFCSPKCQNCKSKCADGRCDKRRSCANQFRYGQCNRDRPCAGAIVCRAISCTPPYRWADCSTTAATDNRTTAHSASCLPEWSSIMKRYTVMGSQGSVLGATVKRERKGYRGRVQRFERGRMYWSKATGPHWLSSGLLARYRKLGESRSKLGLPVSDPFKTQGGRGARFQRGIILNGPKTPVVAVWGPAAKKYRALDNYRGPLGYPSAQERRVVDSTGTAGLLTRFEHGSIVVVGGRRFAVWGRIHARWRAERGPAGVLGHPTSDVRQVDANIQECRFAGGTITYDSATGTTTVVT